MNKEQKAISVVDKQENSRHSAHRIGCTVRRDPIPDWNWSTWEDKDGLVVSVR
jgi:hypothetical protein